jgi:hypothetical protein
MSIKITGCLTSRKDCLKNPITDFQDRQNGEITDISRVESWRSSQMVLSPAPPHQVASMRDMKRPLMKPRSTMKMAMPGKHELMIRRAANHNAHIITPHGKVLAGRKGRKG